VEGNVGGVWSENFNDHILINFLVNSQLNLVISTNVDEAPRKLKEPPMTNVMHSVGEMQQNRVKA
jgi:hypothetical protein